VTAVVRDMHTIFFGSLLQLLRRSGAWVGGLDKMKVGRRDMLEDDGETGFQVFVKGQAQYHMKLLLVLLVGSGGGGGREGGEEML